MALNLDREMSLEDAGLTDFFTNNESLYRGLAEDAYAFASKQIDSANQEVRQDDVIPALTLALRISPPLRAKLAEKKLRQKYWFEWFAELVVDRLWGDLHG